MKVLILSGANPNTTAGIVGKDLLKSLQTDKQIQAKLVVQEYDNYIEKDIISLNSKFDHFILKIRKYLNYKFFRFLPGRKSIKKDPKYSVHVFDQSKKYNNPAKILKETDFTPDVIIVLFIAQFLNFKDLYYLQSVTKAKLYLYLMDMSLFTGGCHYAWDCKNYLKDCGMCPALYSKDPFDQTYINLKYKRFYIDKIDCEIVIPSEELNRQVNQSSLFKNKKINPSFYIPIDESHYTSGKKSALRKEMNLPATKKIIFLGASHSKNLRKGFNELIEALKILETKLPDDKKNNIHLIVAGHLDQEILSSIPFDYTFLGFLDHYNLPEAFLVADIFASSSIQDSGPMMVNQSLMCGTPVVAFDVGVAIDIIETGITGYKAKFKDSEDFAMGLLYLLDLNLAQKEKMNFNCRALALKSYSIKETSNKWTELLLGN